MTTPAPVDPLVAAVRMLRRLDHVAAADQVAAVAKRTPPGRTVVVVGEIKRGKSSLVNALIGRPDAARVDTEISTSAEVRYVPTATDGEGSAALILPDGRRHPVPAEHVLEWVTVDGTESEASIEGIIPVGAEICAPAKHLPGTTIVDTPGVNGLDPRHAAAALAAADGACVLLMVCDSLAPISAAELSFLERVSAEIGTVFLAVTKIDKALGQWRTIVEENRQLLGRHAPQFAGISTFGVSNLFAIKAMGVEDPQRAESLLRSSGVPALAAALDAALGDPGRVVRRNAVQCAMVALVAARADLERRRSMIVDAPRLHDEMVEEKARLEQLRATQKEWTTRLGQRLTRLQYESDARTRIDVAEFRERWESEIDSLGVIGLSRRSQALVAAMTAEIRALADGIVRRLRDDLTEVAVEMLGEAFIGADPVHGALDELAAVDLRPVRRYERWKGMFEPHLITMALAGGSIGALIPGVGLALVPAWAIFVVGFRAKRFGNQNMKKWLGETLRQAQEDTSTTIRNAHNEFGPELRIRYAELLTESLAQAQRLITESSESARSDEAQRKKDLQEVETELQRVNKILEVLAADTTPKAAAPTP